MGSKKFTRMPKTNLPIKIKNFRNLRKLRKSKEIMGNQKVRDNRTEKEDLLKLIEKENKEIASMLSNILNISEHPKQKENIEKLFSDLMKAIKSSFIEQKGIEQNSIEQKGKERSLILRYSIKLLSLSNSLHLILILFEWCKKQETIIWGELRAKSILDFHEIYFYYKILTTAFRIPNSFDNPIINNAIYLFSLIYSGKITIANNEEANIHLKIISCLVKFSQNRQNSQFSQVSQFSELKLNTIYIPEILNAFRNLLIYFDNIIKHFSLKKTKNKNDSHISDCKKIAEKLLKMILNQILDAKPINCHKYLEAQLNPYLSNCLQIYNIDNKDIEELLNKIKEESKGNTILIVQPKKVGIKEIEPIIDEQFIIDD